jgi:hypothetical protein
VRQEQVEHPEDESSAKLQQGVLSRMRQLP